MFPGAAIHTHTHDTNGQTYRSKIDNKSTSLLCAVEGAISELIVFIQQIHPKCSSNCFGLVDVHLV